MINIISQSSLCCDVYQDGNYIGEIGREDGGQWETNITIKSSISPDDYKIIANKIAQLNRVSR